jgi:DNA-binding LacI/PurR family transcriptional regulator
VLEKIQSLTTLPTAIVTMSDIIAIGFLEQALKEGVKIPEQYSVTGFDDIPIARLVSPKLTTVYQPIRTKGKIATDVLVKLIQGKEVPPHTVLKTKLVIRESVMPVG